MRLSDLINELVAIEEVYGGDIDVTYYDISDGGEWAGGIPIECISVEKQISNGRPIDRLEILLK